VRNTAGPRLGPDPVGPHAESLGDLLRGQEPIHGAWVADGFTTTRYGAGRRISPLLVAAFAIDSVYGGEDPGNVVQGRWKHGRNGERRRPQALRSVDGRDTSPVGRRRPCAALLGRPWAMFPGPVVVAAAIRRERRVNYARRQQYRRLSRAGAFAAAGGVAVLVAIVLVSSGAPSLGCFALLVALGLGLYAGHWLSLARRSGVGARSEDAVHRALVPLRAEGWRLRHSLPWQGQGDIDSVAIAPTGVAVAIETKTRTYDAGHLARVREQAVWLSRHRRRWARHGALGVMCVVRVRRIGRAEDDVLVVSIGRLAHVLRVAAGMGPGGRSTG
jgi:hypothetical protein